MLFDRYATAVIRVICALGSFYMGGNLFMDTGDRLQEILAGILCVGIGMEYLLNLVDGKEEWR